VGLKDAVLLVGGEAGVERQDLGHLLDAGRVVFPQRFGRLANLALAG
jgi:hypothetical protein